MKDIAKSIFNRLKAIQSIKKLLKKESFAKKNKVEELKNKAEISLFDISTCKCTFFRSAIVLKRKKYQKKKRIY